ncbi:MAG: OmpH family outer membrane protein [Gemmatimonadaceae bacterium]
MRSSIRAVSLALALIAGVTATASAQSQKLAYIQSSKLLDQAPGRAAAESLFNKESDVYRAEIKRMSDSLQAMVAAFEKKQATLTAAQREAQGRDLQGREAGYQQRSRDLEQKAQQRQGELVQPILDRIKLAIEDVRVEGGYSFIFNADQNSPIVALDKNLDITERVLAKLRAGSPSAVKPAAGAAAPSPAGVTRPVTPPQY